MSDITIRPARTADTDALLRLAALDSQGALTGDTLLAEVCGDPVAALDLGSGRVIADPFRPTADLVELLRVRAAPERAAARLRAVRPALRAA